MLDNKQYVSLVLVFVFGIAAVLSISHFRCLSGDETSTYYIITNYSYADILHERYEGDYNPFLFFFLTKLTFNLLGESVWGLRAISIAAYLGSIAVFVSLVTRLTRKSDIVLSLTSFFVFSPVILYYATTARAYSVLVLISLMISLMYYNMLKEGITIKRGVIYVVLLLIGVYSHFYVGVFAAFLTISLMIYGISNRSVFRRLFAAIALNIVGLVLFVPEIMSLKEKLAQTAAIEQSHGKFGILVKAAFVLHGLFFGETLVPSTLFSIAATGATALVFLFVYIISLKKSRSAVLSGTALVILSVLFVGATGYARPMYAIYAFPFLLFLLIPGLETVSERFKTIFICVLLGSFLFADFNLLLLRTKYFVSPMMTIDYREIIPKYMENKNCVYVISPMWNRSIYDIYSDDDRNVKYFDPYKDGDTAVIEKLNAPKVIVITKSFNNN